MKTFLNTLVLVGIFLSVFGLQSCDRCTEVVQYYRYDPIYINQEEYEAEVSFLTTQAIENPGVIASYGNLIFINELNKGIHVIDNTNPQNPVGKGFIKINNNKHFAIKNDVLLANRYRDLVSVDISNLQNIKELNRTKNVFQDESEVGVNGIISSYKQSLVVEERECENLRNTWFEDDAIFVRADVFNNQDMSVGQAESLRTNQSPNQSTSSSFARFTIVNNHLYVLSDDIITSYNIANPKVPTRAGSSEERLWGTETMFPFQDKLFIGARNGMSIFSLENPSSPSFLSRFEHATGCDPVVADDRTAFVTIREGNECGGIINQLDVVDVRNVLNPQLVSSISLDNPRGLTMLNDRLYVCDGVEGVIAFDISNRFNVRSIGAYKGKHSTEILPIANDIVIVTGGQGIYTLDVSNPANPTLLSEISN